MIPVHITFQRVQTWLFNVPRLRAMVGANTLIGEALREDLPQLARQTGQGWTLSTAEGTYAAADPHDPLAAHDDPAQDAREGILARDGGHFEAVFASGAEAFADAAESLLQAKAPGLRFQISINKEARIKSSAQVSTDLPVLAPCEWTGNGLASAIITQGKDGHSVSLDVQQRHEAAQRSVRGTAKDLASLLSNVTRLKDLERPEDLGRLVSNGYMALIHADGNGVGSAAGTDPVGRASFHHRNRVLLRQALHKAIEEHCPEHGRAPLIPLMLGGDDLMLVCQAELALPFMCTLCKALDGLQANAGNGFKLTLGIGVIIAKHTVPIHHLHNVVGQLVDSAKQRYRSIPEGQTKYSVIDWGVHSTSWIGDLGDDRQHDWVRGTGKELRLLSQRPVIVNGDEFDSLEGLLKGAEKLKGAPRSQLRFLVEQLPRGRALAELAFAELSAGARKALNDLGITEPWQAGQSDAPRHTPLLDLVELAEIQRLGRTVRAEPTTTQETLA
ncbi:MAG TPA: hypothetical protein PL010_01300 [Flavobacteriales bacterium]|nr:hypothetical protein [Flavobacteriales bacterium]MCC6655443.1 hypothetical protein [Flavobacteriales bacterium]HNI03233.1 hypothetical protein [Flavobacteriales bacterium]HNK83558.1 hypothetical protein [Flavobacteriales bacterium]HNM68363.1 hypothetical protein [Flavobacteriales bacterium]